jgi:hypothetical protein
MKRKRILLLVALVAGSLSLLGAPGAEAVTRVRQCTTTGTMTFSSPLTTVAKSGTIYYQYSGTCVVEYPNGVVSVEPYVQDATWSFFGSCITAVVTSGSGGSGVLLGGTELVMTWTGPTVYGAGSYTLVANGLNPCNMSSASVVQVTPLSAT